MIFQSSINDNEMVFFYDENIFFTKKDINEIKLLMNNPIFKKYFLFISEENIQYKINQFILYFSLKYDIDDLNKNIEDTYYKEIKKKSLTAKEYQSISLDNLLKNGFSYKVLLFTILISIFLKENPNGFERFYNVRSNELINEKMNFKNSRIEEPNYKLEITNLKTKKIHIVSYRESNLPKPYKIILYNNKKNFIFIKGGNQIKILDVFYNYPKITKYHIMNAVFNRITIEKYHEILEDIKISGKDPLALYSLKNKYPDLELKEQHVYSTSNRHEQLIRIVQHYGKDFYYYLDEEDYAQDETLYTLNIFALIETTEAYDFNIYDEENEQNEEKELNEIGEKIIKKSSTNISNNNIINNIK